MKLLKIASMCLMASAVHVQCPDSETVTNQCSGTDCDDLELPQDQAIDMSWMTDSINLVQLESMNEVEQKWFLDWLSNHWNKARNDVHHHVNKFVEHVRRGLPNP